MTFLGVLGLVATNCCCPRSIGLRHWTFKDSSGVSEGSHPTHQMPMQIKQKR